MARLRQELADAGVDGEWRLELEHWRAAVAGLKKRVREQQERVAQREEEAEARALREREVSRQLVLEFRSGKARNPRRRVSARRSSNGGLVELRILSQLLSPHSGLQL